MSRFCIVLLVLFLAAPGAVRAECAQGRRMVLLSNAFNPDVLLWDSRQRLLDYAAGDWNIKRVLLPHAFLIRAGTRALVITCEFNAVHAKYRLAPLDAAGVKMTSGPYKGRFGWLMADDLHGATRAK